MHRKHEMEHHKEREKAKREHHSEKSREYDHHPEMMDDRIVKEDHQEGISRVTQRKGSMEVGQHGKMGKGDEAHWTRPNKATTPRGA